MAWPENVRRSDLRIDYYRGSGKGGQHRNKTDSACRITHLPTGLVATAEDERKQHQNRTRAFKRLCAKLLPLMREAARAKRHAPSTERVRTYHEPRGEVKDHRTGKVYPLDRVLEGELDAIHADISSS